MYIQLKLNGLVLESIKHLTEYSLGFKPLVQAYACPVNLMNKFK